MSEFTVPNATQQALAVFPFEAEMTIDQRGHNGRFEHFHFLALIAGEDISDQDKFRLAQAWTAETPLHPPVKYVAPAYTYHACGDCGHNEFVFDGYALTATEPCACPIEGLTVSVELDVPSGKILVGDDFRKEFPTPDNYEFPQHTPLNIANIVEQAAKYDMLHFYVGNSSPGVYSTETPNEFLIGNAVYGDDDEIVQMPGLKEEAWISTDLWWVSMVDAELAAERGLVSCDTVQELTVQPGRYRLTYYGLRRDFEIYPEHGTTVHARLQRIED